MMNKLMAKIYELAEAVQKSGLKSKYLLVNEVDYQEVRKEVCGGNHYQQIGTPWGMLDVVVCDVKVPQVAASIDRQIQKWKEAERQPAKEDRMELSSDTSARLP